VCQVVEDFEAFQHHQVTDKQDDWHFEEIQNGGVRQRVYSKIVILPCFLLYGGRLHHLI